MTTGIWMAVLRQLGKMKWKILNNDSRKTIDMEDRQRRNNVNDCFLLKENALKLGNIQRCNLKTLILKI